MIAKILFLRDADSSQPLEVLIDSQGGNVVSGIAIVDAMVEAPDHTHARCVGTAAGIAALVLAAGTRGHRTLTPDAHIEIGPLESPRMHEPDVRSDFRRLEAEFARLLSFHTRQPLVAILPDIRHGRHFTAAEAIAYGFADHVG